MIWAGGSGGITSQRAGGAAMSRSFPRSCGTKCSGWSVGYNHVAAGTIYLRFQSIKRKTMAKKASTAKKAPVKKPAAKKSGSVMSALKANGFKTRNETKDALGQTGAGIDRLVRAGVYEECTYGGQAYYRKV